MKNLKTHLKNSLVHSLISRWENWVLNRSCYSPTQRLPRGDLRCTVQPFYLAWQPFFFFKDATFIFSKVYFELIFSKSQIIFGQLPFLNLLTTSGKSYLRELSKGKDFISVNFSLFYDPRISARSMTSSC